MRNMSERFRLRADEAEPVRAALRQRGVCEVCLQPASPENLDVHELVPGCCRQLALDQRYATLCATRLCHSYIETLTIPNQLAYLHIARPSDFDLEKYYSLTKRRWPDWDEVSAWVGRIKEAGHGRV